MHGAVFFLSFFFLGISKGMSEQNHVSLTCRYLQGKVCRSPLNMQGAPSVMHHKARYRCRVTKHSSYFWLLGLVSARLSCDEMAGAVCECVRVCMFCSEGTAEMCGLSRPLRLYNIYQPWPAVSFKTDFLFLCNVCRLWRGATEHLVILMLIGAIFTVENMHFLLVLWII